ncbi:hydrolase, alpha/beta fold family protein [Segniliparus rotundus DSM 44985]|uniref:Hydrolase, alpha/beta fold family protein n=1 Tax=Segniliparus rotundus (strain ATCC BAA-972 / CDC 1076 / CIP 108378 / DSM 44985 / JCM 13578) TaxID=640132 RepID=D6Z831_SEGRD|nr:alpha/beta hydrolase [Segniliparus rotundus]ADG98111.1 hydrolase, alpha/beta fold family protein [Segniliparus rotundus DSM 44985]
MWQRLVTALAALTLVCVCAGCGTGPLGGPKLPVYNQQKPQDQKGQNGPRIPMFDSPKTDLKWRECARQLDGADNLPAPPRGVVLECASLTVPSQERRGASIALSLARLRTPVTKPDAAPVVLTTGADVASTRYLAAFAASSASSPLTEHPLVAVDRRGLDSTPAANCGPLGADERRAIVDQMQFQTAGADVFGSLAEKARQYIGDCPQYLSAEPGFFDLRHSEEDIEALRAAWQVARLALVGVGNGASVALAYAHDHPDQIARLVLDSPQPYGSEAEVVGEQRAAGLESALRAFTAECKALGCALGPDPDAKLQELLSRAGSGQLGSVSKSFLVEYIATVLALDPAGQPAAVTSLADTLSDPDGLGSRFGEMMSERFTDGQFLAGCNDQREEPTPERAKELAQAWSAKDKYPLVGDVVAKSLLACSGWPSGQTLDGPKSFAAPVLALFTKSNPIVGSSDPGPIKALVGLANGALGLVGWEGLGYSPLLRSRCAQDTAEKYLNSGRPEAAELYCPA